MTVRNTALTIEEYQERVKEEEGNEYLVVGKYNNGSTKIKHLHTKCGKVTEITPKAFYRGTRCMFCGNHGGRKNTEWFKFKIEELTGNEYKLKGEYTKARDRTEMKHLECGNTWKVTPDNFLRRGSRCPYCAGNKKGSKEGLVNRLKEEFGDEYSVTGEYRNARTKMEFTHNTCGHKWWIAPDTILNGKVGCPECNESKGERYIRKVLTDFEVNFVRQKRFDACRNKNPLPFDFYIPSHNLCIEFDGEQHYISTKFNNITDEEAEKNLEKTKINDGIKDKFCKDNSIGLLRVPYYLEEEEIKLKIMDAIK